MKRIHQFRRVLLTEPDGVPSRFTPHVAGPACHKGSASQSQASTQVGAQDTGTAVSGNNNAVDSSRNTSLSTDTRTDTRTTTNSALGDSASVVAPVVTGNSNTTVTGVLNQIAAGGSQTNGIDPADAQAALEELIASFEASQNRLFTVASSLADGTSNATLPTSITDATAPVDDTDTDSQPEPATGGLSSLQWLAAIASIGGALFLIFRKKKA